MTQSNFDVLRNRLQGLGSTCSSRGCGWMQSCLCTPCFGVQANQILPVTTVPSPNDFLEMSPSRRIRVIHLMGYPVNLAVDHKDSGKRGDEEEEEEEYWFENAAPIRMPIRLEPKSAENPRPPKRIINKFEPQSPPRIAGINPPRSVSGGLHVSPSSGNNRLPRKIIRPTEPTDLDDDDDCVSEQPDDEEKEETKPVVQGNFVAEVLADMSDLVMNITAESTEFSKIEPASSPKPDNKKVASQPDPEDKESKQDKDVKIVVEGSHLGGRANIGFEEDDENDGQHCPVRNCIETEELSDHIGDDETLKNEMNHHIPESTVIPNTSETSNVVPSKISPQVRPTIFFIHGVGGSASTWTAQFEYFTKFGFEVVVPDLLGHGFSSVPDNAKHYTFPKLFRDLLTIFDHYIAEKPCIIVAHSYGCSFAVAIARSRPNSVKSLILIACGGPTPLAPPPAIRAVPSTLITCLKPFIRCGYKRQQKYNQRGKAIKFQEAFDVPSYVFRHILAGQSWPEGDAAFHRRIPIPTLLVYGLKDPLVSLVEMCEMERTIPKAYLELMPLSGHMVMLDQPKEFNTMMKRFIEKYHST